LAGRGSRLTHPTKLCATHNWDIAFLIAGHPL
jgi:hypothetical protein